MELLRAVAQALLDAEPDGGAEKRREAGCNAGAEPQTLGRGGRGRARAGDNTAREP